jgi:MFS family permease
MYYGLIGFVWAVASAVGPLLGGVFTELVTWRWCFWINIPFQGICFVIMVFFLNIHTPKTPMKAGLAAMDWLGSLLVVGGIVMILLGLQFGGVTFPWKSAQVICLIVFGLFSLVLFGLNEWKLAKYPIIPLHIFKYRSNIAVLATTFCHGFVFIGGSYYLPLYFQAVLGHGPIISGVLLLANVVSVSLFSLSSGMFIRKTGVYLPPIWFGMTFMTIGYGLFILFGPTQNLGMIIGFQVISGIGTGPNFQAPLIALQTLVPPRDIAAAVATFQSSRNVATSMSVVIGSVVFQNALKSRYSSLVAAVGPQVATQLAGFNAAASAGLINTLPDSAKAGVRQIVTDSLRDMWIMYTAWGALGLFFSFFITKQILKKDHIVHKTGLAVEEEKRKDREDERRASKAAKDAKRSGSVVAAPGLDSTKEMEEGAITKETLDVDKDGKRISALSDVSGDEVV